MEKPWRFAAANLHTLQKATNRAIMIKTPFRKEKLCASPKKEEKKSLKHAR